MLRSNHIASSEENFWLELSADSIFIDYSNSVKSSQKMVKCCQNESILPKND